MAMTEDFKTENGVVFGGSRDVCYLCMRDLWKANSGKTIDEFNSVIAKHMLEGSLSNKRIWKHLDFCLCEEHLEAILKDIKAGRKTEDEETL